MLVSQSNKPLISASKIGQLSKWKKMPDLCSIINSLNGNTSKLYGMYWSILTAKLPGWLKIKPPAIIMFPTCLFFIYFHLFHCDLYENNEG